MFAPKLVKPQTKAAENSTNSLACRRSTFGARQPCNDRSGEQKETGVALDAHAAPGLSWSFGKILSFPPHRASNPKTRTPVTGPPAILVVGKANDPLEHEADRVADQAMRISEPEMSAASAPQDAPRKSAASDGQDKQMRGVPDGAGQAPSIVHDVLHSPGRPLDAETRAFMEQRLGSDLSGVRVHHDARAAESARAVGARAFAVGQDVVFGAGQYAPATTGGRRLLAHELAHTIQQSGGGLSRLTAAPVMLQRDGPDVPLKEAKKEDAVDPIVGGVKTVASKAADDPKLKKAAIDTATALAGPIWSGATGADKAAIVAGGAAIVGTGAGALLSDPTGRKALSGLPIGAPLSLVPYAIFSGFSYDLPKSKLDPLLLHLSFKGDDLLDLVRTKVGRLPKMTLLFDILGGGAWRQGDHADRPGQVQPLAGRNPCRRLWCGERLADLGLAMAGGPLAPYK